MSKFFIDRPIFASVISLIIFLAGVICIFDLPIAQYPDLVPPIVEVRAVYPGASAEVIAETVSSPLEQKINGIDDMLYMNTISSGNGDSSTSVFFTIGTDPDKAMINVNNRVQMAVNSIPEEVRRYGISILKKSSAILQVLSLYATDTRYDATYLGNYALVKIVDEIKRIPGIGEANVLTGNDYAICIWLKPDKMAKMKITTQEIAQAIRSQNSQRSAGKIGQNPITVRIDKSYSIIAQGRYTSPEQFKEIILRALPDGSSLKLKDVADVELGAQSYEVSSFTHGQASVPIMLSLAPGANALSTVALVEAKIKQLSADFPDGIASKVVYDTTGFVKRSIIEVAKTLLEAMLLVFFVIFIFLKNLRATIIPCLAVPVSIIGTFIGMMVLGFSINTLTLFGLVLAIGIVVDDAIVVIENVERITNTEKLPLRDATIKAMNEVTGPIVAMVLVLCAVFIPVSFMGGLAGVMYKQFAITIAISVVISGVVALTLTPALCVVFLGNIHNQKSFKILDKFENVFAKLTDRYVRTVDMLLSNVSFSLAIIAFLIFCAVILIKITPSSLLPDEDQGIAMYCAMLDPAASLERTAAVMNRMDKTLSQDPSVFDSMVLIGYDMLSGTVKNSSGTSFVKLKSWENRQSSDLSSFDLVKKIFGIGATVNTAIILAFNPPPIVGLSMTGGFEGYIQRVSGTDSRALEMKMQEFMIAASKRPELTGLASTFNANTPQFRMNVDTQKALSIGVPLDELYATMQATFGKTYVNDFTKYGRNFKVMMQARGDYRAYPEQINKVYVRSTKGEMIPLSALVTLEPYSGPDFVERFNGFFSAKFLGKPAAGYTSGQAIAAVEEVCKEILGDEYSLAWIGSAYQEKTTGGASQGILLLGLLMVFLILAAQYERWSLPVSILASVPFALFGAILVVYLRGYSNDIYFQISILTLIGLSAKNAILIVEFAEALRKTGKSIHEAAVMAARLRFRPIMMTSLTMLLGSLPMAVSSGAGSASRRSLGTGIVGGMLGVTIIAPLFIPLFYALVTAIAEKFSQKRGKPNA